MDAPDPLDALADVADAVLFEGYLLYPYRASAQKNALRWQFGVLVPPATARRLAEPSRSRTECVVDPRPGATLRVRLRFLHLQRRQVLDVADRERDRLDVDGTAHLSFDEGVPRRVDATVALDDLVGSSRTVPVEVSATETVEDIRDRSGVRRGAYRRRSAALAGRIVVTAVALPGPYGALRLRVDVVNDAETAPDLARDAALGSALISAHTVLGLDTGVFLSSAAPPEWAAPAVAECVNEHSWPVLAGDGALVLASPIILSDHPQLAPESPTDLFDGTENDEILSLRTLAMTDEEKREARATDPRAARLVDAIDAMGPEMFARLHGTVRPGGRVPDARPPDGIPTLITPGAAGATPMPDAPWWDPGADASVDPERDVAMVGGAAVARGSTVVLVPGRHGDAQDEFLRGARATVAAVLRDVDGGTHVAITVDDDPAADLQMAHGRYRYFRPEELALPEAAS